MRWHLHNKIKKKKKEEDSYPDSSAKCCPLNTTILSQFRFLSKQNIAPLNLSDFVLLLNRHLPNDNNTLELTILGYFLRSFQTYFPMSLNHTHTPVLLSSKPVQGSIIMKKCQECCTHGLSHFCLKNYSWKYTL